VAPPGDSQQHIFIDHVSTEDIAISSVRLSVCPFPSVSTLTFEPSDLWPWFFCICMGHDSPWIEDKGRNTVGGTSILNRGQFLCNCNGIWAWDVLCSKPILQKAGSVWTDCEENRHHWRHIEGREDSGLVAVHCLAPTLWLLAIFDPLSDASIFYA